jgi:hypothetical protein
VLVSTTKTVPDWQKDIVEYLEKEVLPSKKKLAAQLRAKIYDGKWNSLPLLKCISSEEGNYILREIYKGVCGSHSRARVLGHKAV